MNSTVVNPEKHIHLSKDPSSYLWLYDQNNDGNTYLHRYIISLPKFKNFTERLIDVTWPSCFLNIANNDGMTALHFAVLCKRPEIIRQLLVAGANPMAGDNDGYIPLHYACSVGTVETVTALTMSFTTEEINRLKSKNLTIPDLTEAIHVQTNNGEEPFDLANNFGRAEIMEVLMNIT